MKSRRPRDPIPLAANVLDADAASAIFEIAELLVVVLDRDARIVRFNPACEKATGFRAEELLGQPVWRLVPDDQRDDVEAIFRELRDTGRSSLHENEWFTKDGGRRRIAWSNAATRDEGGATSRVIGTGIDVTELRSSQSEQKDSREHLEEIVHSAMDAIVSVDESQQIVLFNPAAEEMFGRKTSEVLGHPLDVLIPERFRDVHHDHVRRFAGSGATSRRMGQLGHVWGVRASGEEFPVEASISRAHVQGDPRLTVILRDVTERERAAEVARRLHQTEELASLGTLITGIAHDIGTPLNVILGYMGMLGRSLRDEKDRERLEIVREQVERVSGLVQTLMNFARPQPQTAAALRVEEVLERALDLIPETARRRGIAIDRDFGQTATIPAQGERLERAFLNLLVNACDAMAERGGVLRVSTKPHEGGVRIRVADTGAGIPEDVLARIFEPFFTTKKRGRGSGLGLFVTRGIIAEQGGTIDVQSEVGKGTEFMIWLSGETATAGKDPVSRPLPE